MKIAAAAMMTRATPQSPASRPDAVEPRTTPRAIQNKTCPAASGPSLGTSYKYTPAHKLWVAICVPVMKKFNPTMRQKRMSENTALRPPSWGAGDSVAPAGLSRAQSMMAPADAAMTTAPAAKTARHPKAVFSAVNGVVLTREPTVPTPMTRPDAVVCKCGGYHRLKAFSAPMRMPAVPAPSRARPAASPANDCAEANRTHPSAASAITEEVIKRGP